MNEKPEKLSDSVILSERSKGLTTLSLRGNALNGVAGMPSMPEVRFLDLSDNPMGDAGLESIPQVFPSLKTLGLDGTRITLTGIEKLKQIPHLTHLRIRRTEIRGQAAEKLLEIQNLNSVLVGKGQVPEELVSKAREVKNHVPVYFYESDDETGEISPW